MTTCLTFKLFQDAGIPAPLCNYANVTVNGENLGTFINIEDMKTDFFEREFDGKGNLYEGTYSDFAHKLTGTFEKKTKNPGLGYIDKVTAAIDQNNIDELERLIDIDKFITFWAMESLINLGDGYSSDIVNYYFHESANGLIFIPWGPDPGIDNPKSRVILLSAEIPRALFHRYLEAYREELYRLLDSVWNKGSILEYIGMLVDSVGMNQHSLRVIRFVMEREEFLRSKLARKNFARTSTSAYHNADPHYGNCNK